ncbi:uncharacterized protein LOC108831246 isoform X1 [Raphanus sativus]|uniref:Uncharacterized protein LOC108831246 isoform X1 n=1 Tax=Raphanus sativus TaxID=3726 RepID=A0A6J0LK33_RAPSA|nr:uncharacterized protein LOC108831246 isoform X1 [Raphanus sativus]
MSPKMRSIFAQVHRKSVSMVGSPRDFSSSAASSKSNVAGFEMANKFSIATSIKLGLCAWASLGVYKGYKYFYPKLLIAREEHKLRLQRHEELLAKVQMNLRK